MKLEVHLFEGLVDVLDVLSAAAQEHGALAEETAQEDDLIRGPEGAVEQSEGMESLDPLAVDDVGLASGNMLEATGVDQLDVEAAFFEDLEERDPINAGGLHGDGGDTTLGEPVGEGVEVSGEGIEFSHVAAVGIRAWRHSDEVRVGSDVHAGGLGVELREGGWLTHGVHLPIVGCETPRARRQRTGEQSSKRDQVQWEPVTSENDAGLQDQANKRARGTIGGAVSVPDASHPRG